MKAIIPKELNISQNNGDILICSNKEGQYFKAYVGYGDYVEYGQNIRCHGWYLETSIGGSSHFGRTSFHAMQKSVIEVIGNIFENPELLTRNLLEA